MKVYNTIEAIEQEVTSHPFVFLYISAEACNVCKGLLPKVNDIIGKYPQISGIFAEIDSVPEVGSKYSIFAVPTLILFIDGREVIRESRYVNTRDLEEKISRYYKMYYE